LAASCLAPCHTFTGIVDQWRSSRHFAVYVANLGGEEADTWTGATGCGNCHAIDGVEQRVKGNVLFKDGTPTGVESGLLGYLDSTNRLVEVAYAGQATVAAVYCTTCHQVNAQNDPHKLGGEYQPGSFGLWAPSGTDDEALVEKSPTAGAVVGTAAGKYTTGNSCIWCHKSRKDVTNYIRATNNLLTSHYWGPHEGPQADVYTGKGGYHVQGQTYTSSPVHPSFQNGCVTCHMPKVAMNGDYADHSFYAKLSSCSQAGCHSGAQNFDVNGLQTRVRQALAELQAALNDAGYITRVSEGQTGPDEAIAESQLGSGFEHDSTRVHTPPIALNADQAGALYNYLVIARGSGAGVHNPIYTQQLLYDSIMTMTGQPSTAIPTRP
jgi:cytochrome c551/c552